MILKKKISRREVKHEKLPRMQKHTALSQKSVAEKKMFLLFLDRNICVGTQKNRLDVTDILS